MVLVGTGGNGGGGLVCARHLHNWGANVRILATAPLSSFKGVPASQLSIVQNLEIPVKHDLDAV